MSSSDHEVFEFVGATFPSVWALELLLALKHERRPWTRQELITSLRASDLVVSRALDALIAAGLASIGAEQAVYLPVNRAAEHLVERAEHLYRSRPNAVRRTIIATTTRSASAFAEAFRIRRAQP